MVVEKRQRVRALIVYKKLLKFCIRSFSNQNSVKSRRRIDGDNFILYFDRTDDRSKSQNCIFRVNFSQITTHNDINWKNTNLSVFHKYTSNAAYIALYTFWIIAIPFNPLISQLVFSKLVNVILHIFFLSLQIFLRKHTHFSF